MYDWYDGRICLLVRGYLELSHVESGRRSIFLKALIIPITEQSVLGLRVTFHLFPNGVSINTHTVNI